MFWNGLGHGWLSHQGDHVGNHDWFQAAFPLVAHGGTGSKEALVIGLGSGITAGTLASSSEVSAVDVYEINPTLKYLLEDFPDGTLRVGETAKISLLWLDGRTGLALSDRRYDVVTQAAPLYLKQAGSSILLSREYMQLVRSRLKAGGVCSIYSNAPGHPGQALLIRRTVRQVFRYFESFGNGYLIVASDSPFAFDVESIEKALAAAGPSDPFAAQVRAFGVARLASYLDRPRLEWGGGPTIVTDDHPLVEYPALADEVVARERARAAVLPQAVR
jgi:spermidine synthase